MRDESSTRTIPLTQGYAALVDEDDYELLSRWSWHISSAGYAVSSNFHHGRPRSVSMHRVLALPSPDEVVHHVNGDGLDNRRENLRACSQSENLQSMRKTRGTSLYKGVFWHAHKRRWRAQIEVYGRCIYLGTFEDEVSAAFAYDRSAMEHFGEFATTNFLK